MLGFYRTYAYSDRCPWSVQCEEVLTLNDLTGLGTLSSCTSLKGPTDLNRIVH